MGREPYLLTVQKQAIGQRTLKLAKVARHQETKIIATFGNILFKVKQLRFNEVLSIFAVNDCGYPPIVLNSRTLVISDTIYGSQISYQCVDGYNFQAGIFHRTITCNSSGHWSPNIPTHCKGTSHTD